MPRSLLMNRLTGSQQRGVEQADEDLAGLAVLLKDESTCGIALRVVDIPEHVHDATAVDLDPGLLGQTHLRRDALAVAHVDGLQGVGRAREQQPDRVAAKARRTRFFDMARSPQC